MTLGKVIGDVVSTVKHPDCDGYKMLIIQPVDPKGSPKGTSFLAFDAIQAGIGDTVLVIDEGGSGRAVLDADDKRTIRTVVSGIVDAISTE